MGHEGGERVPGTGRAGRGICIVACLAAAILTPVWAGTEMPPAGTEAGGSIRVHAVPVPLNPKDPSMDAMGDFRYAGGLALTSSQTDRLHGLSDLEIADGERITAVGDLGILFEARLLLDESGRLTGLTDARLSPLTGTDGKALSDKEDADAEGLALMPHGDRLVSFERHHRIWLYPAGGGPPHPVPSPQVSFPSNGGMEALAPDPDAGDDAYIVGAEVSGETWTCRLSSPACVKGPSVDLPDGFALVAMTRLPGKRTAYLLRAYDPFRGSRVSLRIVGASGESARLDLARPMTVDNFEGVAAVPGKDGGFRFYLISDDNASARQRTLLLAFDWRPPATAPPPSEG